MNLETLRVGSRSLEIVSIPEEHPAAHRLQRSEVFGKSWPRCDQKMCRSPASLAINKPRSSDKLALNRAKREDAYGTGRFLLMNPGERPVPRNRDTATVAYRIGCPTRATLRAREQHRNHRRAWCNGCTTTSDSIQRSSENEALAASVPDNSGVYFCPAFSGLSAPYWKTSAARRSRRTYSPLQRRPTSPAPRWKLPHFKHAKSSKPWKKIPAFRSPCCAPMAAWWKIIC